MGLSFRKRFWWASLGVEVDYTSTSRQGRQGEGERGDSCCIKKKKKKEFWVSEASLRERQWRLEAREEGEGKRFGERERRQSRWMLTWEGLSPEEVVRCGAEEQSGESPLSGLCSVEWCHPQRSYTSRKSQQHVQRPCTMSIPVL